jgi:hypothetical protein
VRPLNVNGFLVRSGDVSVRVHTDRERRLPVRIERTLVEVDQRCESPRIPADDCQHQRQTVARGPNHRLRAATDTHPRGEMPLRERRTEELLGERRTEAARPGDWLVAQQARFPSARVVKSLNQLGYYEFETGRRPRGAPGRIAVAAAGDDRAAVAAVMQLIDRLGFDAIDAGALEAGRALQPDGSTFGASYSADELTNLHSPTASSA